MLAKVIATRRKKVGLTQEQLAEAAGVSRGAIAQLELGMIEWPRPATLQKIAAALQTTIPWLLRDAGIIPPTEEDQVQEIAELARTAPEFVELISILREDPTLLSDTLKYARYRQHEKAAAAT